MDLTNFWLKKVMICCLDLTRTRTRIKYFFLYKFPKLCLHWFEFSAVFSFDADLEIWSTNKNIRKRNLSIWLVCASSLIYSVIFSVSDRATMFCFLTKLGKKVARQNRKYLSSVKDKNIIKTCCVQQLSHWKKVKKCQKERW